MRVDFATDTGEFYSVNMRYLRQQLLRARQRNDPSLSQFVVRIPAPDVPDTYVDGYVRTDDLYLFGIGNQHGEFYFRGNAGIKLIGNQHLLGFTGHYNDLGSYADLTIDRPSINAAVTQLSQWRSADGITNKQKDRSGVQRLTAEARHLMMLILVICEAARFFEVEKTIANALDWRPNTPLSPIMVQKLSHEWAELSKANDYGQVAIMTAGQRG